jgi:protein-S-isoprenylcysteine O-methyltransferase Ste14
MYSAIIMWCVAIIMVLPSIWVAAVSVVVAAVITIRAELEEAMLTKELPGYSEYQSKVRWRVIPYIW